MEDFEGVQQEIADKLQHGFDTRHIYQMFSTFVDTIQNQSNQISEMRENAERSELLIENMSHTIQAMEMNIQGFVTLPPVDTDDGTLKASRRPSINSSRRPSIANSRRPSVADSRRPSAVSRPRVSSSDPPAETSSPREEPAALHDVSDVDENEKNMDTDKDKEKEKVVSAQRKSITTKGSSKGGRKQNIGKFKKRRIIRQMSMKLKEDVAGEMEEENESAVETAALKAPTGVIESTSRNELAGVEDTDQWQEISPPQVDKLPHDDVDESLHDPVDEELGKPVDVPVDMQAHDEHPSKGPIFGSDNEEEVAAEAVISSGRKLTNEPKGEMRNEYIGEPSDNTSSSADQNISELRKVPVKKSTRTRRVSNNGDGFENKGGRSRGSSQDNVVDSSARINDNADDDRDTQQPMIDEAQNEGEYQDSSDSRATPALVFSQIDPTQTVVYRISSLESQMAGMAELIEKQRNALEEQRLALEAVPARNEVLIEEEHAEEHSQGPLASSFDFYNMDDTPPVSSKKINVEVEADKDIGMDMAQEFNTEPAKPVDSNNIPYDDTNVVKFTQHNVLPAESAMIISKQVCGSDPMKKLLERVVKSTEKMVDQGIKRIPKPPPQTTANDLLTNSIVATLAKSMLKRGLLDELKSSEENSPRIVPVPVAPTIMQPTPTKTSQSGVSSSELKSIADSILSKEDILAMIQGEIEKIPPPVIPVPRPPPRLEVAVMPRAYKEMESDDSVGFQDTVKSSAVSSPCANVREPSMGERARTVLEQHVESIEHDKASTVQLDSVTRNLTAHVSTEVAKVATHYEGMFEKFSSNIHGRQDSNEKSLLDLRHALNEMEHNFTTQLLHVQRPMPKKKEDDAWKSDLHKVSQSINKAREDQRNVAKMLVEELENLQNQMKHSVDERRLEHLTETIEEKIKAEMGQSVSGINSSMARIISAVRTKTDRHETESLIQHRLHEAEESLKVLQEDEPAGAFKCISCGTAGKSMTPNLSHDSLSFASVLMSQSAEVKRNRGGDHDQAAAVLNRQAGLRPVSRQQKPMTPKTYTPSSAPSKEMTLEPLYRRAKHANHVREIPKIPNITFGVGNQNQYKMDDSRPNSPYLPQVGTQSAPSSKGNHYSGAL